MMLKVFSLPDRIFKFTVLQLFAGKNYINKIWLKKASLSFYICIEEDYGAVGGGLCFRGLLDCFAQVELHEK